MQEQFLVEKRIVSRISRGQRSAADFSDNSRQTIPLC
jgi:hypothetical protein